MPSISSVSDHRVLFHFIEDTARTGRRGWFAITP
jgi:hypothetical protein